MLNTLCVSIVVWIASHEKLINVTLLFGKRCDEISAGAHDQGVRNSVYVQASGLLRRNESVD